MVFGGTRRRGLNLTPMSEDGSPFQTRGRKARMGLPAKCMHFVGSPGWRGRNIPRETYTLFSCLSPPQPPSERYMSSRITPKQTGTDLNPTENTFGGDPEKMFILGRTRPRLNICAPMPHRRCGPRLDPVPVGFNALPRERKYPCFVLPVAPQGAIIKVPNIHVMRDARQKMIT